jgi:hypothetical protein
VTTSIPARTRSAPASIALSADAAAVAGLVCLCGILAALTLQTWGDLGVDTGYDLLASSRMAHGAVPYVDFIYYYGPLGIGVLAAAVWATGNVLGSAIALGIVLSTAIVVVTYVLARSQVDPLGSLLAAAIVAPIAFEPSNLSFVLPHSLSEPFAVLATLCVLLSIGLYAKQGGTGRLVLVGFCLGLVTLTRPEFALAAFAAVALWLALRWRLRLGDGREVVIVALFGLAVPLLTYGAFLTRISLHRLVYENLYPVDAMRSAGDKILRLHAPLTISSFVDLGLKTVLYGLGTVALLVGALLVSRVSRRKLPLIAFVAVGVAAGVAAMILRPETVRYWLEFVYGWIPAGAVLFLGLLLARHRSRASGWTPSAQLAVVNTMVLAVLAAKVYHVFLFHTKTPQYGVMVAPFAVIFLVSLHLRELASRRAAYVFGAAWLAFLATVGVGLTLKDAKAKSVVVRGPGGSLREDPRDAPAFQSALNWIARETKPGEPILLAPQLTALYVMAERPNPLPQLSLLPGALPTRSDQLTAERRLAAAGVQLIVIDRRQFPEYGHTSFGGSFDRLLARWVQDHFKRLAVIRGDGPNPRTLVVWLRRGHEEGRQGTRKVVP